MLSVLGKFELLEAADDLVRRRDFEKLGEFVTSSLPGDQDDEIEWKFYRLFAEIETGNIESARRQMDFLLPLFDLQQGTRLHRRFVNLSGILLTQIGDLSAARDAFTAVLTSAEMAHDRQLLADAVMNLGVLADLYGRWEEAVANHSRAMSVFAQLGEPAHVAGCHHNMAMTYRQLGLYGDSDSHFEIALQLYEKHGSPANVASTALERALLLLMTGDFLLAEAISRVAYVQIRNLRHPRLRGESERVLGLVYMGVGNQRRAYRHLNAAFVAARRTDNRLLEAETCQALGEYYQKSQDEKQAMFWLCAAEDIYHSMGCHGRALTIASLKSSMKG